MMNANHIIRVVADMWKIAATFKDFINEPRYRDIAVDFLLRKSGRSFRSADTETLDLVHAGLLRQSGSTINIASWAAQYIARQKISPLVRYGELPVRNGLLDVAMFVRYFWFAGDSYLII